MTMRNCLRSQVEISGNVTYLTYLYKYIKINGFTNTYVKICLITINDYKMSLTYHELLSRLLLSLFALKFVKLSKYLTTSRYKVKRVSKSIKIKITAHTILSITKTVMLSFCCSFSDLQLLRGSCNVQNEITYQY